MLQEFGIHENLLMAIKSLYCQPEVYFRANGKQSKSFYGAVGLRKGMFCHLSFFIISMIWIDKLSQTDKQVCHE